MREILCKEKDATFARADCLLCNSMDPRLSGDHIYATITFTHLAKKLKKTDKSVHRMLGPRGNPRADNIIEIIKILQTHERVRLRVEAHKAAA